MGSGFAQIFRQIVTIRVKTLSNAQGVRGEASLLVDLLCSKTRLIKLLNNRDKISAKTSSKIMLCFDLNKLYGMA